MNYLGRVVLVDYITYSTAAAVLCKLNSMQCICASQRDDDHDDAQNYDDDYFYVVWCV